MQSESKQRACLRCGSNKIMAGLEWPDHFGDTGIHSRPAGVEIHGEPTAWIFKDTTVGKLTADICGECGYVEMQIANPAELWSKHLKARGSAS